MKTLSFVFAFLSFFSFGQNSLEELNQILDSDTSSIVTKISNLQKIVSIEKGKAADSVMFEYYSRLGSLSRANKEYDFSLAYYDTILANYPSLDQKHLFKTRERISETYRKSGKGDEGMKVLLELLAELESKNMFDESARLNNKIGVIFLKMDEYKNAEYHLRASIKQAEKIEDFGQIASSLMSLGNRFKSEDLFEEAEKNYKASIELCEEHGLKRTLAGNYNNFGSLLRMQEDLDGAMKYYRKAVQINKEIGNDRWLSYNYNNLGNIYDQRKNYQEALRYYKMSDEIKVRLDDERGRIFTLRNISLTYDEIGNLAEAYKYHKAYAELKDSLDELDRLEQTKELAAQFQSEKREAEILQLNMQDELNKAELEAKDERIKYQNFLGWLLGIGILLVIVVAFVLWRSVRQRNAANLILEEKNRQIDEKNREIIDSINYAKRIQNSILPDEETLNSLLGEVALLYRPKDIISGDFYICESANGKVYFGTVDCTGHGVPGAMVSVVASAVFNKVVHELGVSSPEEILRRLNDEIPRALSTNKDGVQDGMDMALCCFDKATNTLLFSGANQNCWVFNQKNSVKERIQSIDQHAVYTEAGVDLGVLKGNRNGIGSFHNEPTFDLISMKMVEGDTILLSTDGYQDQFGGPQNKKFKVKQLRELIFNYSDLSPGELSVALNDSLKEWQGEEEQIDDVCVMIVQIS